jgi:hypothetical protein
MDGTQNMPQIRLLIIKEAEQEGGEVIISFI